jgi:hypothetical protein
MMIRAVCHPDRKHNSRGYCKSCYEHLRKTNQLDNKRPPRQHGHCVDKGDRRGSLTYQSYCAMKQRCLYPKAFSYAQYGGRGIRLCDRWRDSFQAFLDDMGERPTPKHSIGRIDNDGPYEPDNCQWFTRHEQSRNRSDNHWLTVNGQKKTVTDWSTDLGGHRALIVQRLGYGWSPERAVTEPVKPHAPYQPRHR